jgi:hypothetical protein
LGLTTLNIALQKNWDAAVLDCTTSLSKTPNYVKALMRRAQALEAADTAAQQALDPADKFNTEKYSTTKLEDAVKGTYPSRTLLLSPSRTLCGFSDLNEVLKIDSSHQPAAAMQHRLASEVQRRQTQMKDEMMGKLKDFGNMFLNKFGMSTNDFQMQQDPNSGSYNMSYQPGGK